MTDWNIKDKHAVVTFRISGRSIEKWSGKDPVSKWLKNNTISTDVTKQNKRRAGQENAKRLKLICKSQF